MEAFEQKALAETLDPPRCWKRYVDNAYTMLKKGQSQTFTDYLNTVDDNIKWKMEREVLTGLVGGEENEIRVERALTFLDTMYTRMAPSRPVCRGKRLTLAST